MNKAILEIDKPNAPPALADRNCSKREAAQLLGICTKTLDKLIAEKEIRVVRIRRRVLVPLSVVQRVIRGR